MTPTSGFGSFLRVTLSLVNKTFLLIVYISCKTDMTTVTVTIMIIPIPVMIFVTAIAGFCSLVL